MAKTFDLSDDSVVVVIGSGAGGGTLSNELAQKGIDVVCLEAGSRLAMDDIVNDDAEMFVKMSWLDKRIGTGDLIPGLPAWICKTVGGSTMHWAGASLRFQEHEWKARTTYGGLAGTTLLDWPIDAAEMERYYIAAENNMGVTGRNGIPMLPGNNNYKVLEAGAKRMGYEEVHTGNMAINPATRDGRPGCQQIGFCMMGCAIGAKWSTMYVEVPKAEATGHFELRPDSMALNINHDATGKVTGVVYADKDGNHHEQKARIVAIAGNSVETPRLLLNSGSSMFPDGLANSSGQVGRNYMRHMTAAVYAIMPGPVSIHRGTMMAGIIMDESHHNDSRGFAGGYELETLPLFGLAGAANIVVPGAWGREYAKDLEMYNNMAGLWIVGEDMPQESNRITLHDTETDQHGLPVPVVHFVDHANDIASGRAHDVPNLYISDGSQFTTGAAENPTLTIVALAIRQAEKIAAA
jgi:choline dehydrogenase-like flavoprotein